MCYNLYVAGEITLEGYPSPVEGTGLENQQVVQAALVFESLSLRHFIFNHLGVEQSGSSSGS